MACLWCLGMQQRVGGPTAPWVGPSALWAYRCGKLGTCRSVRCDPLLCVSERAGLCCAIRCSVWPLRRCCMVRHRLAMLLRGFSLGHFWGGSSKWGREGTCTRAGAFPNPALGAQPRRDPGGRLWVACLWCLALQQRVCGPTALRVGPSVLWVCRFFMLSGAGLAPIWWQAFSVILRVDWVACNRLEMGLAVRDACEWW